MAIRFESDDGVSKPAMKEVGGKTYVAEEPSEKPASETALPFAKPVKAEKKGRKPPR